jgi:hypothetical protein
MTISFGIVKKLAPGHYRIVHPPKKEQHHTGTPCGYCNKGRRADATGILCSSCKLYVEPRKWAEKQKRKGK